MKSHISPGFAFAVLLVAWSRLTFANDPIRPLFAGDQSDPKYLGHEGEYAIAADPSPQRASHIVGAAMTKNGIAVFSSTTGMAGLSNLTKYDCVFLANGADAFDPCVAFDHHGNAYVAIIDDALLNAYVFKSSDLLQWTLWATVPRVSPYPNVNNELDKPAMAIGADPNDATKDVVYLGWTEISEVPATSFLYRRLYVAHRAESETAFTPKLVNEDVACHQRLAR